MSGTEEKRRLTEVQRVSLCAILAWAEDLDQAHTLATAAGIPVPREKLAGFRARHRQDIEAVGESRLAAAYKPDYVDPQVRVAGLNHVIQRLFAHLDAVEATDGKSYGDMAMKWLAHVKQAADEEKHLGEQAEMAPPEIAAEDYLTLRDLLSEYDQLPEDNRQALQDALRRTAAATAAVVPGGSGYQPALALANPGPRAAASAPCRVHRQSVVSGA